MKIAIYKRLDGKDLKIKYDENAPCIICGLPVVSASMGGTVICPWCDCGVYRDGTQIGLIESLDKEQLRKKAKKIYEEILADGYTTSLIRKRNKNIKIGRTDPD